MPKNIINANMRWLTICLLLVLAILLLYANLFPSNSSASVPSATPTPQTKGNKTKKQVQPTRQATTSIPQNTLLDVSFQDLPFSINNAQKLIKKDTAEINTDTNSLTMALKGKSMLYNRQAALVIVYVEGSDQSQDAPLLAQSIIKNILMEVEQNQNIPTQDKTLFSQTKYQWVVLNGTGIDENGPLSSTNSNQNQVNLQIFLYAQNPSK